LSDLVFLTEKINVFHLKSANLREDIKLAEGWAFADCLHMKADPYMPSINGLYHAHNDDRNRQYLQQ